DRAPPRRGGRRGAGRVHPGPPGPGRLRPRAAVRPLDLPHRGQPGGEPRAVAGGAGGRPARGPRGARSGERRCAPRGARGGGPAGARGSAPRPAGRAAGGVRAAGGGGDVLQGDRRGARAFHGHGDEPALPRPGAAGGGGGPVPRPGPPARPGGGPMSEHVRDRLSAYLDQELVSMERTVVETHLHGCEACRWHLETLAAVDSAVRALPIEAPSGYFDALPGRVRARLERPAPRVRQVPLRLPAWTWAAAAALVLGVVTPLTM